MSKLSIAIYNIDVKTVSNAISVIRSTSIHPSFIAYLCIKRTARVAGKTEALAPKFKDFFDEFLRVGDGSDDFPYILPFTFQGATEGDIWFNKNVAGSYAPSSIRPQSPLSTLCTIDGQSGAKTFSLKSEQSKLAPGKLIKGAKINAISLAIFLYRDFGFSIDQDSNINDTASELVDMFRFEFGFRKEDQEENELFQNLFDSKIGITLQFSPS